MASKKAKKIVAKKAAAKVVAKVARPSVKAAPKAKPQITGWKRFLIALGLSLVLVIPLTALAQTVNHAVLGAATEAISR